jgi:DNA-binding transcriptional LysR family regulator
MNLRQLRSLATILDRGSFVAAGDQIGLKHSVLICLIAAAGPLH